MKNLFLVLIFGLIHGCGCVGIAQTEGVKSKFNYAEGVDYQPNMIVNPSADLNTNFATASGGTFTRDTTSGNKINGKSSFKWQGTSLGQYVLLDTQNTYPDEVTEGQCEFKGRYKGTAAGSYSVQILDGSSNVLITAVLKPNATWTKFSVGYPCGAKNTRFPVIKQTTAGTPGAINFGKLYYGNATNIGDYTPPTGFSARMSSTGVVSQKEAYFQTPCTKNSVGNWTCNYVVGKLSSNPYCVVTPDYNAALGVPSITAQSNTAISFVTPSVDVGVNIICDKTGADAPQTVVRQDLPILPKTIIFNSSGTYTPTPGTSHIIVKMVGGGGGGAGSGTASTGGSGGAGGNTSFGTSLLVANGGLGGTPIPTVPTTSYTLNSPAILKSVYVGSAGTIGTCLAATTTYCPGGAGAAGLFGGGTQSNFNTVGYAAAANTGAGGGGAANNNVSNSYPGSGGSAGLGLEAQVNFPSGSYTVTIGAGGTAGAAGTSGLAGSTGGSGRVEITEYYQLGSAVILPGGAVNSSTVIAEGLNGRTSFFESTYTPTWSGLTNITSLTAPVPWMYFRMGKSLFVWGTVDITITSASAFTAAVFTLPSLGIGSFANVSQCSGSTINYGSVFERRGVINSVSGTNTIRMAFVPGTYTAGDTQYVNFSCRIP